MKKLLLLLMIPIGAIASYSLFFRDTAEEPQIKIQPQPNLDALRSEIQARQRNTGVSVLLIGWDAADWQIVRPLLEKGQLPNLKRLMRDGASAHLHSQQPMLSPLLWNTAATGKSPIEHGVLDFLVLDPVSRKQIPINSSFRKTMALWNILSEADRSSAFVAWWATYPAEQINGYMVTDRVSYSLFGPESPEPTTAGLTWPEDYYDQIRSGLITKEEISNEELGRFINLTFNEIGEERKKKYPEGKTNPVDYLAQVIASTKNYHRISLDLLERQKFDLFSCYYEAIDQAGHLFQHCMEPRMNLATDENYKRYRHVVPRMYEWIDSLTGELLTKVDSQTAVILMSDHGFKNGPGRPTDSLPYISERPAYWHREYGMFVASRDPFLKGITPDTVTLLDITPTILYLLGVPAAHDMKGRVLFETVSAEFENRFPSQLIASWEPFRKSAPQRAPAAQIDQEMMENLAALGYIGESSNSEDSTSGRLTSSYHRNLANLYLSEKKYNQAEKALHESMKQGAVFETYELLFQLYKAQGKNREAANKLREGYERFPDVPDSAALKAVDFYIENGMLREAEDFFRQNEKKIHEDRSRIYCRARINEGAGKIANAEAQYKAALRSDPTFIYALERLYQIMREKGNVEELEEIAQTGLKKNNQLGLYHNVLGVVHKKAGRFNKAVHEYNEALQIEPDNGMFMANLGAAYLSMGKPELALEVLKRARQRNDQDPEIWINLGAVYGALGQTGNGLEAFEKARSLGVDSPNVELGLAGLYAQEGRIDEAIKVLEKATARFPGNPDLNELLTMLRQEALEKGG